MMFAKLSALAMLVPFVSALGVSIRGAAEVQVGAAVIVDCDIVPSDPSAVAFVLVGDGVDVELDVNVVLEATVELNIPDDIDVGVYTIIAAEVGDTDYTPIAATASIEVVARV